MRVALELFAENRVSATSYQMIADALGVTKAAVYHQFKTKNELIIAVTELELARLVDATVAHPLVVGVDTDVLKAELLDMARKVIDLPGG